MAAANLDAANLAAVPVDGLIKESVDLNKIWDVSGTPLVLSDMIGSGTVDNARFSWTQDSLADPDIDDQVVDGSDTPGNDTKVGLRVQNFCEERTKVVRVSERANASGTIGYARALAYNLIQRQKELRRNVEATACSNNASQADNGTTVPGVTGALDAWLITNTSNGDTGANGGFNTITGLVDAYTPGTPRPLAEVGFKDLLQSVYEEADGDSLTIMARPSVVRKFSEYQFTAGARVATLTRDTMGSDGPATALGAVNVYIGDFNTCTIRANKLQPAVAPGVSTMFILDPAQLSLMYLQGYQTKPLAKDGLAENRLMFVDWGLRVGNEKACAAFRDIDESADMVAA